MNRKRIFEVSKRKKVVVGVITMAILLVGIGGGYVAYTHTQNNKVLSGAKQPDSLVTDNTLSDKKDETTNNEQAKQEDNKKDVDNNKKVDDIKPKDDSVKKVDDKKEANNTSKGDSEKTSSSHKEPNKEPKENTVHKTNQNTKHNKEKQTGLAGQIANTKIAKETDQIILVSGNELSLWNKSNGKWNKELETSDRLGYGGLTSNKHEGDGATPTGVYPILYSFGFGSNPGTSLEYKRITENSYFVDDTNSEHYNQWYEGKGQKGEHMIDHSQYRYGMVVGYNTSHTPGKGSAIFLHCNGRGSTAGCVSVPEGEMLKLLRETHSGAYIIITSSNSNLKYY